MGKRGFLCNHFRAIVAIDFFVASFCAERGKVAAMRPEGRALRCG